MSLATATPQQSSRLADGPGLEQGQQNGQSQGQGPTRRNNQNNGNQNRRRRAGPVNPGEMGGDVMPGTGAYLLQQQQQQQQQQQARPNRSRRGNQIQGDGSASVPPPAQPQPQQQQQRQQPNGQAAATDNADPQGQGRRRPRPPRHRNRPAQAQSNGEMQTGSQPLSRVPTNGSTAGSNASTSNAPTNRRGQARARGFNSQLTEPGVNGEDGLDPSAGAFVPGDRAQRGRNAGNQARRAQLPAQGQSEMDQPPHMGHAHSASASAQYQIQDQQNQARSRIQPQTANRRNARTRKPFQGNLSSGPVDFEEMQERAVMGGAIPAVERKYRGWGGMKDEEDGLVSKLVRGLGGVGGNWLECVICFSTILPQQPIWSCSPTTSTVVPGEVSTNACCFTPFHLSCIQDWSSRSLAEAKEKARDRDTRIYPEEPVLTWRCPGCQKRRVKEANKYECYCGKVKNLSSGGQAAVGKDTTGDGSSLVLPHSCGNSCSRDRSYCGHPCPLQCHPGPCPPCQVPLVIPCPSHKKDLVVKCSLAKGKDVPVPACEEPCERLLACQAHACDKLCHDGDCAKCTARETVKCYCGVDEREVACGWRKSEEQTCGDGKTTWQGRFGCERVCARPYDCGKHTCEEECHPHPLETLKCPRSPALVTHCPCGRTPLGELSSTPRNACTDKIPTCALRCNRPRSNCDHPCGLLCHEGECTPCRQMVVLPCRCGSSTVEMICSERQDMEKHGQEVLCERVCKALRSCGRHECARFCCPLSYQAKYKGKKRDIAVLGDDEAGLHTCSLPCNKILTCGVHHCPKPDHRGPCPPCLEASYEELGCNCGRTVIHPPIRCGTVIDCTYPCARPAPECGHPKVPHTCHETEVCPPCPYLTTKKCACGKNEVKNVRCSQEKVTCGVICNSLLSCGYHHCMKPCHSAGDCEEPCQQVCQKPKRLCKHPCPITCHAPSACPEDEPCSATVDQTCPCGHVRQRTACGACTANPVSREAVQLKCVSECAQRQRNARLAEALGIKPTEKLVEYPAELRSFATANHAFVLTVEKAFNDFFMGPKQATLLPHTPAHKRQFILGLAEIYRFGTELVDADPHRSVQLRRRIDSRIPNPLLSAAAGAPPAAKRQLGGLGDMKKPFSSSLAGPGSLVAPNPVRGWGSASLSRPASPQVHPSQSSSNLTLTRSTSQPANAFLQLRRSEAPHQTGSGIHKLDHIKGSYTPPQKRDFEENAKDWDEEDDA